jgi:hypothetical protein
VFPFLLTICLAGLGYASYKAESDGAFEAQVKKVPGAIYILSPFRKAISGLVTKPPQHTAPRENDKKEEMEPVSVTPPTATIDSDVQPAVDPYAEIDAEVKAELNVSAHDDQSESATAPHPLASADHPEQKPDRQETDIHDATVSSSASSSSGAHAPVASAHVTERQDSTELKAPHHATETAKPSEAAAPATIERTKAGNVQLTGIAPDEVARLTDSKVLKTALADSAREYLALRRDVESTLLKDVHQLNEHDLRIRIKQLATEMFERLAWEDLRLNQSLKGLQAELTEKYTDLMRRQQRELELEVNRILFAYEQDVAKQSAAQLKQVETAYQKQLEDTVRAQAEGFHATMQRELEQQRNQIVAEVENAANNMIALERKTHSEELLALQPQIVGLEAELKGIKNAVDATGDVIKKTIDIHHLSAAVLSLELALSSPPAYSKNDSTIEKHLKAVRTACQGDEVVTAVLDSLPARVATSGVLPLADLQVRFGVMREEVRKAALVPESAPHLLG